jgi:hypothetical protein
MRPNNIVLVLGVLVLGCSSPAVSGDDAGDNDASTADGPSTDDGGQAMDAAPADGAADAGSPLDTGIPGDGFGAARTACINEINKLRATQNHKAYALWTSPTIDKCVDDQATNDEKAMSPHQAWLQGKYPTCNGNGQDECLGYGVSAAGVVKCLDAMWNEKNQPNCAGCAACSGAYNPNCPNCDFYGKNGPECGHYVNMSADYFTKAACGFSTLGGWAVQNFSQ